MTATIKLNKIFKSLAELDSLYRSNPTLMEKKIIKAVGNKYYLDYIHCQRDTAIVSTKNEKYFVGLYISKMVSKECLVGFAMGSTDGRQLFAIPQNKLTGVKLRNAIEKAMLNVKQIRR